MKIQNIGLSHKLTRRSVLGLVATTALTTLPVVHSNALQVVNGVIIGKDQWLFLMWDDPRYAEFANIKKTVSLINRVAQVLHKAGIELVISLTPAKGRIYRDYLPDDLVFSAEGERRYSFALDELTSAGVLAPDLATPIQNLRTRATPDLYFKADTHWTASGAEAAAECVATAIKAKWQMPPPSGPGMPLGPAVPRQRPRNDLADALGKSAAYPLETFHVHLPVRGGEGLIDQDNTDITVVGSSYMAPEHNFAPMLSNRLNRPVALFWRVYAVGPYQTLLAYLKGRSFHQHRPKLIVWDFHEVGIKAGPELEAAWTDHVIGREAFVAEVQKLVS